MRPKGAEESFMKEKKTKYILFILLIMLMMPKKPHYNRRSDDN